MLPLVISKVPLSHAPEALSTSSHITLGESRATHAGITSAKEIFWVEMCESLKQNKAVFTRVGVVLTGCRGLPSMPRPCSLLKL